MTSDKQYTTIIKPSQDEAPVPFPAPKLTGTAAERFLMKDKVTVITGAAGSIGGALADAFALAGSHVAIMDFKHNPTIDQTLREKYGVKVQSYTVDVTNFGLVKETVRQIEQDFGTIDTFIANAGVVWTTGSILNDASILTSGAVCSTSTCTVFSTVPRAWVKCSRERVRVRLL